MCAFSTKKADSDDIVTEFSTKKADSDEDSERMRRTSSGFICGRRRRQSEARCITNDNPMIQARIKQEAFS